MRRFREWVRWEFGRRIEVTLAIRLITLERFAKAALLILGGVVLVIIGAKSDLHHIVDEIQDQLNLSAGQSWWQNLAANLLRRFGNLTPREVDIVAIGAILYGALEAFEGTGLLLRRRG